MQTVIFDEDSVGHKCVERHTVWHVQKRLLEVNATFDVPEPSVSCDGA